MLAFVSVCAATAGAATYKQQPTSAAQTDLVRIRLTIAGSPHDGSRLLSSSCCCSDPRLASRSSGYFFAFFFAGEQWILVVLLTVEPSWKLISAAPGQYPRGQLVGVMMPLTWNSVRLPWTFL